MKNNINLDILPTKYHCGKECIDWENSIGMEVSFIFNEISGIIKIKGINTKTSDIMVEYQNHNFVVHSTRIRKCALGFVEYVQFLKPELVKYFVNKEDALKHKCYSTSKIKLKCVNCGTEKVGTTLQLSTYGIACKKCGDGISYPEKFMRSVLEQNNIKYQQQVKFMIENKKRYWDFVIEDKKLIIEMDGGFHYTDKGFGKLCIDTQENDKLKDQWAINNGYTVYRIDSQQSNMKYLKDNIINTIDEVLDISKTDYIKAGTEAESSLMIKVCEYKKNNPNSFTKEIANEFKIHESTAMNYMKAGSELGLCEYDSKEETKRQYSKISHSIEIYKDGILVGESSSTEKCANTSLEIYGIKFSATQIRNVLKGVYQQHKGYTFKYKN